MAHFIHLPPALISFTIKLLYRIQVLGRQMSKPFLQASYFPVQRIYTDSPGPLCLLSVIRLAPWSPPPGCTPGGQSLSAHTWYKIMPLIGTHYL